MFSLIFTFSCITEEPSTQPLTPNSPTVEMESTGNPKPQMTEWRLGYGTSMDGDIEPCG